VIDEEEAIPVIEEVKKDEESPNEVHINGEVPEKQESEK
jgi:hypothetical protein